MELTQRLRTLRLSKGITQEALAAAVGVTAQAVSKWERGAALPDVSLLPELSVYFGVSLDELFGLTEEKEYDRIQNMLWDNRLLSPRDAEQAERWLNEKIAAGYRAADCCRLKADLYNHQAGALRDMAAQAAKDALAADPQCKGAMKELTCAMGGYTADWYARNHFRLIAWLETFVEKHPDSRNGFMTLMENLLDDGRTEEAARALAGLEKADRSYRVPLYRAKLFWRMGKREEAWEMLRQMARDFPEEWLVPMNIGEFAAMEGDYPQAIEWLQKAVALQKPPRYADGYEMLAQLYELTGDIPSAIGALEEELRVDEADWGFTQGESADSVRREIARLRALL